MTPGARVAAKIEVLDAVLLGVPAEKALTNWGRNNRFAGSKDRCRHSRLGVSSHSLS